MMINEDKLERECTQKKAFWEKNRCFKGEEDLRWVSLIFFLLCSSPRLPLACGEIKQHKQNDLTLKRKIRAIWTQAKPHLYHPQRFTDRW